MSVPATPRRQSRQREPDGPPPPPVVQRLRLRYAKRGRLRFTSHRDFARAFERALRRAEVPMGYSAGFSPHPKISYLGAAPTGVASEAEYLEIGLAEHRDPEAVRAALDACLPAGLDIEEAVPAMTGGFAERIEASHWRIELAGLDSEAVAGAVAAFLAADAVAVQRMTKNGNRTIDARAAVVTLLAGGTTVDLVVRLTTPAVRPDDVLAGLRHVAGLEPSLPPQVTRLAQGRLLADGSLSDPLADDRG
ncbi:MAG: DUF2344 domain-containing protein [Geodermatophilaceae bacterium]|nr:DUF2344 domain-containing protein [Geodermatophilaceae bacterium]